MAAAHSAAINASVCESVYECVCWEMVRGKGQPARPFYRYNESRQQPQQQRQLPPPPNAALLLATDLALLGVGSAEMSTPAYTQRNQVERCSKYL